MHDQEHGRCDVKRGDSMEVGSDHIEKGVRDIRDICVTVKFCTGV